MRGLRTDGLSRLKDEPVTDDFFYHHLFRLHGIPPHEAFRWSNEEKRIAFLSLIVQLEEEQERLKHGIGRVM